jgi:hypothetical protein
LAGHAKGFNVAKFQKSTPVEDKEDEKYTPEEGDIIWTRHGESLAADPTPAMVTRVCQNRRLCVNLLGKDQGVLIPFDDVIPGDDEKWKGKLPHNHRWYPTPKTLEFLAMRQDLAILKRYVEELITSPKNTIGTGAETKP